ncbi:MAG: hypothetical protein ACXWTT_12315 [Methylobacter sp.]
MPALFLDDRIILSRSAVNELQDTQFNLAGSFNLIPVLTQWRSIYIYGLVWAQVIALG